MVVDINCCLLRFPGAEFTQKERYPLRYVLGVSLGNLDHDDCLLRRLLLLRLANHLCQDWSRRSAGENSYGCSAEKQHSKRQRQPAAGLPDGDALLSSTDEPAHDQLPHDWLGFFLEFLEHDCLADRNDLENLRL